MILEIFFFNLFPKLRCLFKYILLKKHIFDYFKNSFISNFVFNILKSSFYYEIFLLSLFLIGELLIKFLVVMRKFLSIHVRIIFS